LQHAWRINSGGASTWSQDFEDKGLFVPLSIQFVSELTDFFRTNHSPDDLAELRFAVARSEDGGKFGLFAIHLGLTHPDAAGENK
jgi:hypothetical protein